MWGRSPDKRAQCDSARNECGQATAGSFRTWRRWEVNFFSDAREREQQEDDQGYKYKRVKVLTGRTYDGAVQILNAEDFDNKSVQFIRGGFSLLSDESSDGAD